MATKWYVEQVLEAGCAFVNCIPVFIASQDYWRRRFAQRRLPIIGDDIKSQVGATRSEEHTSELQSLMRISYAVFCLKKKTPAQTSTTPTHKHIISHTCQQKDTTTIR